MYSAVILYIYLIKHYTTSFALLVAKFIFGNQNYITLYLPYPFLYSLLRFEDYNHFTGSPVS